MKWQKMTKNGCNDKEWIKNSLEDWLYKQSPKNIAIYYPEVLNQWVKG